MICTYVLHSHTILVGATEHTHTHTQRCNACTYISMYTTQLHMHTQYTCNTLCCIVRTYVHDTNCTCLTYNLISYSSCSIRSVLWAKSFSHYAEHTHTHQHTHTRVHTADQGAKTTCNRHAHTSLTTGSQQVYMHMQTQTIQALV